MLRSPHLFKAILNVLHTTGLDRVCAPLTRGDGVIFMLHHVCPRSPAEYGPNRILSITPEFLQTVIRQVIESGFELVSLDEAHARMAASDAKLPPGTRPFACFTLDDGYRDNRDYAYPIFRSFGVPFTIYVAPEFADGRGELWWLTLEDTVNAGVPLTLDIDGRKKRFDCETPASREKAFQTIYWWLRTLPDADVRRNVRELAAQAGIDPYARCRDLVMNWDELRELAADPLVTIGAHTLSHVAVAKLPQAEARDEMAGSLTRIEQELNRPCRHFSYPYGDPSSVSARDARLAADLGFKTAVTTSKGVVRANGTSDLHALRRFSLNGDYQHSRYFKVLLSGLPFAIWNLASRLAKGHAARPDAATPAN